MSVGTATGEILNKREENDHGSHSAAGKAAFRHIGYNFTGGLTLMTHCCIERDTGTWQGFTIYRVCLLWTQ